MRYVSLIVIAFISLLVSGAFQEQESSAYVLNTPETVHQPAIGQPGKRDIAWADSVLKTMSTDEKIGQLFMISAYSNRDTAHTNQIERLIKNYSIGGLIFFQGGPVRQAHLTNRYQQLSKIPLMIAMDAEWGLSMRLDSCIRYPKQMALAAIDNDSIVERLGYYIGKECKRLGVHVNFAPVCDVNNNSANPVINIRSFGENREKVARLSTAYMKGMHKAKVMACAKHFPGHGDTETDSHYGLPLINHSRKRLDSLEFFPFKTLIKEGIPSIMVGHMSIPSLDTTQGMSSVFSSKIITDLLKKELNYKGLIFTDALNMQGAKTKYGTGEIEINALLAGNDFLICSDSAEIAINRMKTAVAEGRISVKRIDESVKKILIAKHRYGANKKRTVKIKNLYNELNHPEHDVLASLLAEKSLTLTRNNKDVLPFKKLDTLKIALVTIGDSLENDFTRYAQRYAPMKIIRLGKHYSGNIKDSLTNYNLVLTSVHYSAIFAQRNYLLTSSMLTTLNQIQEKKHVLVLFGNPYAAGTSILTGKEEALIFAYENTAYTNKMAAEALFGGATISGKLPVTVGDNLEYGKGLTLNKITRLRYVRPEEIGIKSSALSRIDSIAQNGVDEGAYPGCVVLAAKDGKVFYQKAFGSHTFDNTRHVQIDDIYDLASVSKIAGSVVSLMKLTDQKKFNLDDKLGKYLPKELDSSVYAKTVIRNMLAHQAGFVDWIPFFMKVVKNGKYDPKVFRTKPEPGFTTRIHDNLYILDTYEDSIFKTIRKTPLRGSFGYKYSDLGYYFLKRVVNYQSGKPLDVFARENFYQPLGLTTMGYNPRNRFSLDRIPPTEDDKTFRYRLVHGDVHDQGAAMVGGVGGHAGLFANANDVAVIFQMMMNYGTYGGERYINDATLREWTKCQFCANNRRGAGFDRPTMSEKGPTCDCVSAASFGHTGFTGITAWADPDSGIIYVFLSNRSHPFAENPKIINMGIRTRIQQVIYDAVNGAGKPFSE